MSKYLSYKVGGDAEAVFSLGKKRKEKGKELKAPNISLRDQFLSYPRDVFRVLAAKSTHCSTHYLWPPTYYVRTVCWGAIPGCPASSRRKSVSHGYVRPNLEPREGRQGVRDTFLSPGWRAEHQVHSSLKDGQRLTLR